MKFIHLSDLHLGKRVNEFSMLEDQRYILEKIIRIIKDEMPCTVLIAGDVYDKSVPSAEAVCLFDDFLTRLAALRVPAFIISGNHDSPERIAFGGRIMESGGIYLSPVYDGASAPVTLEDEFGSINVYMLPFLKPALVRHFAAEDAEISSYTEALREAVDMLGVNPAERNILVTHQFVTGAERCDSEEVSVGGADNVDESVFSGFDYVALGHIHGPQNIGGSGKIRYCGSPLKYSFSEVKHNKSVTVAELREKGSLILREIPLVPMRDMSQIRGEYNRLMDRSFYEGTSLQNSYLRVTLTDEDDVPEAMARLRSVYPYIMKLEYDNIRTRSSAEIPGASADNKTPFELFSEFYEAQNGRPMSEEQEKYIAGLLEKIEEERA